MRFEKRQEQRAQRRLFALRMAIYFGISTLLVGGSLAIGMLGYEHFEGLPWRDAFLNSAMLLGGMGPVDRPETNAGKVFAGCYALYAGLVFLVAIGVALAPAVHRVLHSFHVNQDEQRERIARPRTAEPLKRSGASTDAKPS
jgi:hypothetical protein